MVKLIHFPISTKQKNNNDKKSLNVNQRLKLVVSNCSLITSKKSTISRSSAPSCFKVEVWSRGPNLYEMHLADSTYSLRCDLILEVDDPFDNFDSVSITCHFPNIDDSALKEFVEEDETLLGVLMIQFQMRILEQLFLFCATHYASKLIIFTDDVQADELGIYRDFLTYKDEIITAQGEKTAMIIPVDQKTFDQWIDFMEKVDQKFRKTLWREQKYNFALRQYLKSHSVLNF